MSMELENIFNWIGIKEDCGETSRRFRKQLSTEVIVTDQLTEELQS